MIPTTMMPTTMMPTTMMPTTMMPTTTMPTTMNPTRVPTSNPLACSGEITHEKVCGKPAGEKITLLIGAGESTKYCWETITCALKFFGATDERLYFILKLADHNEERIFTLGNPGETYTYRPNTGPIGNVEFIVDANNNDANNNEKNEGTNDLMFSPSCGC
eukprot:217592_1